MFDLQRFTDVSNLSELTSALESGGEIKFTSDITLDATLSISQDTTLDLNGHTLSMPTTNVPALKVTSGTLTVSDTSSEGKGGITASTANTAACAVIVVDEGAALNLTGGTITDSYTAAEGQPQGTAILVNGIATIDGGTVTSNCYCVYNAGSGSVTVTNGTITGGKYGIYHNSTGTVSISGGTIENNSLECISATGVSQSNDGIVNAGNITISGGTFTAGSGATALGNTSPSNTVAITGGTFNGNIVNTSSGTINISNATITGKNGTTLAMQIQNGEVVYVKKETALPAISNNGTVTVSDSSVTGSDGISNGGNATLTINSGSTIKATASNGNAVNNSGTLTVNGGTIEAEYFGIYNKDAGTVTASNATVKGTNNGIYHASSGTVNLTGVTISDSGTGINVAPQGTTTAGNVTVSGGSIDVTNTGISTSSTGTTFTISDVSIKGEVGGITSQANNTFNISNSTIEGTTGGISNNEGTFTLTDSTVTSSNSIGVSNNKGTLNVTGGSITSKGASTYALNNAGGTVDIKGATITGNYCGINLTNSKIYNKNEYGYDDYNEATATVVAAQITLDSDTKVSGSLGIMNYAGTADSPVSITAGQISASDYGVYNSGGYIAISGGTVSGNQAVMNASTTNVTISGTASITGSNVGVYNYSTGNIVVNGGTIAGTTNGVRNNSTGKVTISGGSVTSSNGTALYNSSGNVTVSGGSVSGKTYGVNNASIGSVNISSGTIAGTTAGAYAGGTGNISISGGDFTGQLRTKLSVSRASGNGYSITGGNFDTFTYSANANFLAYTKGTNATLGYIGIEGWNETTTQGQYFYLDTADSVYGSAVVSLAGVNVNGYESVGVDTANSVFAVPSSVTLSSFATTGSKYQPLTYIANKTTASELKSDAAIVIDSDKLFGATTTKIDGSENAQAMSIIGGNGVTEITGGTGADSLIAGSGGVKLDGGTGKDTLTGGAGSDTFIYNGGENLIKNYGVDDIVNLDGIDAVTNGASIKANETGFIVGFGTGSSLTFAENVEAKVRSNSQIYTYSKDAITLNKSVTLTEGATFYSLDSDNTYNAVNALAANQAVSLIGNAFANTLTAGNEGSTLDGKDGNDNLYGGAKADVFIYGDKSGKDAIYGYSTADSLKVTTDKIVSGTANSNTGDLVFKIDNSNAITFKPADDGTAVEKILLAESDDSLTKDGRIKNSDKMLEIFSEQKGRVDLGETIYSGVAGIDASKITDNVVTMTGGSLGGAFIFANNKKKTDVFEYGGGAVSLSGYTAGVDKIDLGEASLQSFTFGEGSAVSLTTDKGVISLDGAQGKEVLLRDATAKNNSFSKMIFFANGVLHDKEKNPTSAILSAGAGDTVEGSENKRYTAANTIKKITVGNDVTAISVQASSKNTIIDASNAGAGVSLIGGKGNDKFTGREKGADTFVYTAGKDIITNYEVGDSISAEGFDLGSAKITQSRKSVTLKFDNKNSLAIKSEDAISTININGTAYNFGKNAVISGGAASLTSNFSGTYKAGEGITLIDGSAISKKNFTMQGTKSADTLIGGSGDKKKVTFKGGGATSGADSLVGGASKDTFFYAKNDTGAAQVTNFDYANDNVKIKRTLTGIRKISSGNDNSLEFEMSSGNTLTLKTDNKNNNIGSSNVLIKANNTLYWFEGSGDDYGLYTAKDKESKAAIKSVLRSKDSYAIVDLNYSTNLVKGKVADVTETVFTSTMADNYKIK